MKKFKSVAVSALKILGLIPSEKTNKWRLDQVERCLKAKMPKGTIILASGKLLPEALVEEVKNYIK